MRQTVLSKPGAIGLSFAGVEDKFKVIANILMMGDRLLGYKTEDDDITHALEKDGIDPSPENVKKVRDYFTNTKT